MNDNELKLPDGKIITFNDQQYEGIQKIREWLKSKKLFFTLSGFAGVGKTSIIKKILDTYNYGVVVSAPTHKACRVIENITQRNGKTLHSLLGLRPDLDLSNFNPNFPQFNPIATPRITDYNFCIIDECSMINKELFELIEERIKNTNTKVLFMGDDKQIPPIGEKESVVFFQENIETYTLTKVERQQNGNPLLLIYDDVRNNLNTINGGFLRKTNINSLDEGVIFTTNKNEFRKFVLDKFLSEDFANNSNFCKLIAWKNDTVMKANNVIRSKLIGSNVDIVEKNDILMGYRTISNEKQTKNIIENSVDYRVIDKSTSEENKYGIKGYNVRLREELTRGRFRHQDVFIVDVNDRTSVNIYSQMHDYFLDRGKENKRLWKGYYEFRRNHILIKNIDKHINGQYRNDNHIIVKDIDYSFAITSHKSQGSTYNHTFVMLNDIEDNPIIKERNQIFYVAISRPSISATIMCNRIDL